MLFELYKMFLNVFVKILVPNAKYLIFCLSYCYYQLQEVLCSFRCTIRFFQQGCASIDNNTTTTSAEKILIMHLGAQIFLWVYVQLMNEKRKIFWIILRLLALSNKVQSVLTRKKKLARYSSDYVNKNCSESLSIVFQ